MAYRKEIEQVFKELDTSKNGLSSSDAASRLKADGYNELTEGKKTPLWKMFFENLADPLVILKLRVLRLLRGCLQVNQNQYLNIQIKLRMKWL